MNSFFHNRGLALVESFIEFKDTGSFALLQSIGENEMTLIYILGKRFSEH